MRKIFIAPIFLIALISSNSAFLTNTGPEQKRVFGKSIDASDIMAPQKLPRIGKWMFQENGERADWLGVKWKWKKLFEPINIVFIDTISKDFNDAISRLNDNLKKAGFSEKSHHSSGYIGFLCDRFYNQIPAQKYRAFADDSPDRPNNHGRIFGPCLYKGAYVFIGAFSREEINPSAKIEHQYGSFSQARDKLSQSLVTCGTYKIEGRVNLDNAIKNSDDATTGDHDGEATVLKLR